MKKFFTKKLSVLKLSALTGFVVGSLLLTNLSYGQSYYSKFSNPNSGVEYKVTNPSGCSAPKIENPMGIADNGDDFAFFKDSADQTYSCSQDYTFYGKLDLPSNLSSVDPSDSSKVYKSGFRIKIPTSISGSDLGKNITITTYLDGAAQEVKSGSEILATDLQQGGVNWLVFFDAQEPFDGIKLTVDPKIIPANQFFEFDVLFSFVSIESTLPAQITNFKASVSGKNVNLSWQSLIETNVSNYRIERSSNGGLSYSAIAAVPAKGNSNTAISYAYSDAISLNGNYLYRIVTIDKNGYTKATNSIAAIISGQGKLLLYPTIVKAGQNVTVKTSETGLVIVHIYDAQGRLVKQQRTSSTGQFSVATTGLSAGVYNVKLICASGVVLQSKIIVN